MELSKRNLVSDGIIAKRKRRTPHVWNPLSSLLLLALVQAACGPRCVPEEDSGALLDMSRLTVVDLTHPFDENTLYWPTSPSTFELEELAHGYTEGGYFYSANRFCTPEHGGTHLDAPIHFDNEGHTVQEIPVERLIGPGVLIDVRDKASEDSLYRLAVEDVLENEEVHGRIPEGAIVLLHTGWWKRWPDRLNYFGDDTPEEASHLRFPSYGEEAARFLIEERRVAVLGVDTASIDYGPSQDFRVHRIAAQRNVPGLENLTRLDQVPARGAWIVALPMKIAGGTGAPLRTVAMISGATTE